jgi:catechol 2,3-dioxygenase-like lactoylglutathione lyase family enzyme
MTKPENSGIAPFFIVKNVPAALSFYRDRLGFNITFRGPADDVFFGTVQRGTAMIMFKNLGVAHPCQERSGFIGDSSGPVGTAGRLQKWP